MKIYTTRTVPEHTTKHLQTVVCDLCKSESSTEDWAPGTFDIGIAEVSLEEGQRFPESADVKKTRFDICPRCFKERLVPWLREQGAEPTVEHEDWF